MNKKARDKFRRDYSGLLVDCIGAAILAGFPEHAKTLHNMSLQAMGLKPKNIPKTDKPEHIPGAK